jgi:hypothetical protein
MIVTPGVPQIQTVSPQQHTAQPQPQLQTQVITAEEELACHLIGNKCEQEQLY